MRRLPAEHALALQRNPRVPSPTQSAHRADLVLPAAQRPRSSAQAARPPLRPGGGFRCRRDGFTCARRGRASSLSPVRWCPTWRV
eukprot:1184348-Prorocentrum_minimum.AAC.3